MKKTIRKPCIKCGGTGDEYNRYGTRIDCRGCRGRGSKRERSPRRPGRKRSASRVKRVTEAGSVGTGTVSELTAEPATGAAGRKQRCLPMADAKDESHTAHNDIGIPLDFETQEQEDQFIRAAMSLQIWSYVVDEDIEKFHNKITSTPELYEAWDKAVIGESHDFGVTVADHYGLPYKYADDRIILGKKYEIRRRKIRKKLDIDPSFKEKLVNSVFFGVLSRD